MAKMDPSVFFGGVSGIFFNPLACNNEGQTVSDINQKRFLYEMGH